MKQEGVREGACSLEKRQEEEEKNGGLKTAANLRRTGRDRDSSCVSFQRALWIAVNSTWIDEAACSRPCSDLSLSCKQGGKEGGRGCPNQEECFIPTRRFGKSETPSILGPISSCVLIQPPRSFCTSDSTILVVGEGAAGFLLPVAKPAGHGIEKFLLLLLLGAQRASFFFLHWQLPLYLRQILTGKNL